MNIKMVNVISAIDGDQDRDVLIQELSSPELEIGFRPTVIKLLEQMTNLGLISEKASVIKVTSAGQKFFEEFDTSENIVA